MTYSPNKKPYKMMEHIVDWKGKPKVSTTYGNFCPCCGTNSANVAFYNGLFICSKCNQIFEVKK